MAGKAIGKSLKPEQRETLMNLIPTLPISTLEDMREKINEAQKNPTRCVFNEEEINEIDFALITPTCCRWTIKLIDAELDERSEFRDCYFND